MIRIGVVDDVPERWVPVIERSFRMTLAPLQGDLGSLRVRFRAPGRGAAGSGYVCTLEGTTSSGRRLGIEASHDDGNQAIVLAFTRARREIGRGRLGPARPPARPPARGPAADAGISGTDVPAPTR